MSPTLNGVPAGARNFRTRAWRADQECRDVHGDRRYAVPHALSRQLIGGPCQSIQRIRNCRRERKFGRKRNEKCWWRKFAGRGGRSFFEEVEETLANRFGRLYPGRLAVQEGTHGARRARWN